MKQNIFNRTFYIKIILTFVVVFIATLFTHFDYFLYKKPIATVVKVDNITTGMADDEREMNYTQTLKLKIRNGKYKGQYVTAQNKYFYSQFSSTKYSKGNDVFIFLNDEGELKAKVLSTKVDMYAVFIISVFIMSTLMITGKKGVLAIGSLIVNIVIFVIALQTYTKNVKIELTTTIITLLFIVLTMIILNGISKKSIGAILSSLVTVGCIFLIYEFAYKHCERPSFEVMNYIYGNENLDALFLASVILGSLGAIMDVSITINSSVAEIIRTAKKPTVRSLINSVREISYDIMGTMVNVLFFSYISGSIPMFLLKIKNGYSFPNIIRFDIIFELLRFVIGSIGIVLAIPISGAVAILIHYQLMKNNSEKEECNVSDS